MIQKLRTRFNEINWEDGFSSIILGIFLVLLEATMFLVIFDINMHFTNAAFAQTTADAVANSVAGNSVDKMTGLYDSVLVAENFEKIKRVYEANPVRCRYPLNIELAGDYKSLTVRAEANYTTLGVFGDNYKRQRKATVIISKNSESNRGILNIADVAPVKTDEEVKYFIVGSPYFFGNDLDVLKSLLGQLNVETFARYKFADDWHSIASNPDDVIMDDI